MKWREQGMDGPCCKPCGAAGAAAGAEACAGALMLAAAMMLDHVKLKDLGDRLRSAISGTLNADNVRTGDLGGKASTRQFTDAIVSRIKNG
ncbi:MAG: hypothetical protein IPL03_11755 [Sterolibacteriaceae bacterium]|nr:hypothetical protein [Candidatus Methylophosphatis haderslevensis]